LTGNISFLDNIEARLRRHSVANKKTGMQCPFGICEVIARGGGRDHGQF
jgi:hypothetical protein